MIVKLNVEYKQKLENVEKSKKTSFHKKIYNFFKFAY